MREAPPVDSIRKAISASIRDVLLGEAERVKRDIEDQLSGRRSEQKPEDGVRSLQACIDLFIQDKRVQGVTEDRLGRYIRELHRLQEYCEGQSVSTVYGVSRELLTGFCATWDQLYPSAVSLPRADIKLYFPPTTASERLSTTRALVSCTTSPAAITSGS